MSNDFQEKPSLFSELRETYNSAFVSYLTFIIVLTFEHISDLH